MLLTVNYPLGARRLVLRTSLDWELDVLPRRATSTQAEFELSFPGPLLELKPCLWDGDALHWSKGQNYVLSRFEGPRALWPYFFSPEHGHVSDVLPVEFEGVRRSIRVYHPPGYDENPLRAFPVLYMQDGRNLFFPEEAFQGTEWRVDETMDQLDRMNAIRKCLVVGIAPADRHHDYTAPGVEGYGRFVVEKLKPLVDGHLRTRPGPQHTVVMGSSLGGVAALHLAWTWPQVFGRVACLSSTFGYRDELFSRIEREPKRDLLVYLDSGWPKDNFEATNAMRDLLMQRGYQLGVDLLHQSFPEGRHGEGSWAERLHLPFQFFFGRAWLSQRREES